MAFAVVMWSLGVLLPDATIERLTDTDPLTTALWQRLAFSAVVILWAAGTVAIGWTLIERAKRRILTYVVRQICWRYPSLVQATLLQLSILSGDQTYITGPTVADDEVLHLK